MKKQAIVKSLLILLPILAVGLATAGDTVQQMHRKTASRY